MDAAHNRFTLHFRDTALERSYREAADQRCVPVMRLGSMAGVVFTLVPSLAVHFLVPREWLQTDRVLTGAFLISLFFAFGYAISFLPGVARHAQLLIGVGCCQMAAVLGSVMRALPPEFVAHRGFMFLVIQLFTMYGLLRLRIVPGVIAGALSLGIFLFLVQVSGQVDTLDLARQSFWLTACNLWGILVCYQLDLANRREFVARLALEDERARSEGLLLNILPGPIASRLKDAQQPIAEHSDEVTVLFADLVGFTPLSAAKKPGELVALLDHVFTEFDLLAQQHGLEKIKTIGDAYMAVAGLPQSQPDHALRAGRMALAMLEAVRRASQATGEPLQLRVGLHSGPVVAGVIGRSKFSYDLWGDTVNTASRMESSGVPDAVQCTPATAERLNGEFRLRPRGVIDVKGKGPMETYLLAPALSSALS